MDSLINAAAQALAAGDPLGALKRVALREDPPALALRGIAMAQLGDFLRARTLLRRAARAFGAKEVVARARCVLAEAEVALVSRDLGWPAQALAAAHATLARHGDRLNAAHARHLEVRHALLLGRLDEAEALLGTVAPGPLPPPLRTRHALMLAGIAIRRLRTSAAQVALARAEESAREAGIPGLRAEVETARGLLEVPAARVVGQGGERLLRLHEVETLLGSEALVVDACRHLVRVDDRQIALARRPVLFALARALGEAWPDDVPRDVLVAQAFGARVVNESHRARLRVELGRLRRVLRGLAEVRATPRGFILRPVSPREVVVLARPVEEAHGAVLALLGDGESWSSSALALALGTSQRTVQRALDTLAASGKVQALGQGRARRWLAAPLPPFTTTLLLPSTLVVG